MRADITKIVADMVLEYQETQSDKEMRDYHAKCRNLVSQ